MKKALLITLGVLVFIVLALAVAPFLFKDQIKARIDKEIAASVNAQVYYDPSALSLSFFRHFPSLSVSLERFGVVGIDKFAGDTLASIGKFSIAVDAMSLISGDKITINTVELERARIQAIKLADGSANWDIAKKDTTAKDTSAKQPTQFKVAVKRWAISDAMVSYVDGQSPMNLLLVGLNHTGSGDFTQDVFDLDTKTDIESVSVEYDSVQYLSNKRFSAKLTAVIDQPKARYTLKDNEIKINDMGLGFNGWVEMPASGAINTDMTFKSLNGSFKELLSLVPGVYTKDFGDIKAEGAFALEGSAQGTYKDSLLPRLALRLKVTDGQVQYPKLPSAITGINLDLGIDHAPGTLESLIVDLKSLSLKVGKNPLTARARVQGLANMLVEGNAAAKLNLAEISQAFPMEGLSLKGLLSLNVTAKGVYSAVRKRMPAVQADIALLDGYVKSASFPEPIEQIAMQASVQNGTGRMEDTHIRIPSLNLVLEGKPFYASATIDDLVNYRWDAAARGTLDLAKITKIYPIKGTNLAGLLLADIKTRGAMADVTAGRYDAMPTSGTLSLTQFAYKSESLPQGVQADKIDVAISPSQIDLKDFTGKIGRSDARMSGHISNYWGYALRNQTLKGSLAFNSTQFDANEWVSKDPAPKPEAGPTEMAPVVIPRNLDVALQANIGKLLYDNLVLTDAHGQIVLKDGILDMRNLAFNTLDGQIGITGTYDSRNLAHPAYALALDVKEVAIPKAYQAFNTVKTLAPVAERLAGKVSTKFNIKGELNDKMSPVYPTMQGGGLLNITQASLSDNKLISGLNSVGKLGLPTATEFKDLLVKADIVNGLLNFKPFDINVGGQKLSLSGQNGFDQSINWDVKTLLPAGSASKVSALPGVQQFAAAGGQGQAIPLNFKVTGTQAAPKFAFAGLGSGALDGLKDRARQAADQLKQQAEQRARAEADRLKNQAQQQAQAEADKLKDQAKQRAQDELNKAKERFGFPK